MRIVPASSSASVLDPCEPSSCGSLASCSSSTCNLTLTSRSACFGFASFLLLPLVLSFLSLEEEDFCLESLEEESEEILRFCCSAPDLILAVISLTGLVPSPCATALGEAATCATALVASSTACVFLASASSRAFNCFS